MPNHIDPVQHDLPSIFDLAVTLWGEPTGESGDGWVNFGTRGAHHVHPERDRWVDHETGDRGDWHSLYVLALGQPPPHRRRRRTHRRALPAADTDTRPSPEQRIDHAWRCWCRAWPARGTLAECYLLKRAIGWPPPRTLRFVPRLRHPSGAILPALIAAIQATDGSFLGVHRIYLTAHGAKTSLEPAKASLGCMQGGAVRLALPGRELILGEGIENVMSVMQMTGLPGWAALTAGNLDCVVLPACVHVVWIAADADPPGEDAANRAGWNWQEMGRTVRILRPDAGYADFNDMLQGGPR